MYDVIVIGAGVTGCSIARELARKERQILVLEASSDICEGTSKANSGIVHAGHDAMPGSLKARLNVRGNQMMGELAQKLQFPYRQNGSLILCFEEENKGKLQELYERGIQNGVQGLQILTQKELRKMEPNLTDNAVAALYAPTGGIVCPFGLTIAMAENAAENGVLFQRNQRVTAIEVMEKGYRVHTADENVYEAAIIINAAGVHADEIHNMLPIKEGHEEMHLIARKGEYCLYDKKAGALVDKTIFQLPGKYGKGILVTPTVHGNLLIGPTAVDIPDKNGVNTTGEGLETVMEKASVSVKKLPPANPPGSCRQQMTHSHTTLFCSGILPLFQKCRPFLSCQGSFQILRNLPCAGRRLVESVIGRKIRRDLRTPQEFFHKSIGHLQFLPFIFLQCP